MTDIHGWATEVGLENELIEILMAISGACASIAHPLTQLASETISGMTRAMASNGENVSHTRIVPFDIYTRENL